MLLYNKKKERNSSYLELHIKVLWTILKNSRNFYIYIWYNDKNNSLKKKDIRQ